MINTRSIQFRLILWYSCLLVLVTLSFGAYTYYSVRAQLYSDMENTLTRRAHQIATNILPHDAALADLAATIHSVYSPEANGRFIRILRADRSILYVSGDSQEGHFDPAAVRLPEGKAPPVRIESLSPGNDMLITAAKAEINGHGYTIEMGAPTSEIEQMLHGLLAALFYGLSAVILMVSAGGCVLVNRALKPVEDMRSTAERITFGNLRNRLPVVLTGDALEHLSVTLNQMLDRLESAYDQASRFSADASHELRTPLTIMRGELEALAQEKDMPAKLQERVGSVLEETERLSRITGSLFAISRLDAGEAKVAHNLCDLAALARSTAEQMALMAEEKHLALSIHAAQAVPVMGDSARLKQIVVNLLDNAIKYTSTGGRITLTVSAKSPKAVLEIADDGIGISARHLPHVFERFYRTDRARSRAIGGAGLGMSIVRSIVHAHGGSVRINSREGEGTTVAVELPLVTALEQAA